MPHRALIIDDDPSIRTLLSTLLRRRGFEVDTAPDGEEGIRKIQQESPSFDVVLLDLMMPRVDGHAVVARVQSTIPHMLDRIIVTTAFPQAAIGRLGFACPILPKPFDLDQLLGTIERRLPPPPASPRNHEARVAG